MTQEEAINVTGKLLTKIYYDDSNYDNINIVAQITTAVADGNVDYLCSALDELIKFCEKLKKGMYKNEV